MPKKLTLLEQAKLHTNKIGRKTKEYSLEEEELCMAWLVGEVTLTQVSQAMKLATAQQAYNFLALCARQLFQKSRPR